MSGAAHQQAGIFELEADVICIHIALLLDHNSIQEPFATHLHTHTHTQPPPSSCLQLQFAFCSVSSTETYMCSPKTASAERVETS